MKKGGQVAIWVIIAVFLVAAIAGGVYLWSISKKLTVGDECIVKEDCLPVSCCNAADCIAKENAPDCTNAASCGSPAVECSCERGRCVKK
jgi:hypothetical protein